MLTGKDTLAIEFARKSPENKRLVHIDDEYIEQHHMCCLLEPHAWLEDVVSTLFQKLHINTHVINLRKYRTQNYFNTHT